MFKKAIKAVALTLCVTMFAGSMDTTAATLCSDNNIPILVFSIENPENIVSAVCGEKVGTLVK